MLWALLALGFLIFVWWVMPGAWEEHKRSELERAVLEFVKAVKVVSVSITATRKQVIEFSKALEKLKQERQ